MAQYKDLKKELNRQRHALGFLQNISCSPEETVYYQGVLQNGGALPPGIYYDPVSGFVKEVEGNLTEEERKEYLAYMQANNIRTTKNCMVFFTVLTIISLVVSLVNFIIMADAFT